MFVWDQQNYLLEADGKNVVTTVYTNEPDRYGHIVSSRLVTSSYQHCFDAQGSTCQVTDASALNVGTWLYDASGSIRATSGGIQLSLLWIGAYGYYFDSSASAIYYIRRRTLSIHLGRWHSRDPIQSFRLANRYTYVRGRLTTRYDPTGLVDEGQVIQDPKKCTKCNTFLDDFRVRTWKDCLKRLKCDHTIKCVCCGDIEDMAAACTTLTDGNVIQMRICCENRLPLNVIQHEFSHAIALCRRINQIANTPKRDSCLACVVEELVA